MSITKISAVTLAVSALVASTAIAQDKNLSTLQRMGNTDTNMNIATVPQDGQDRVVRCRS